MNHGRSDLFARLLARPANRRQVLSSVSAVALGAGLARSHSFAKQPTVEPTQTPASWVFEGISNPSDFGQFFMTLFGPFPRDWNAEHPERVVLTASGIQFFDYPTALTFGALNEQQVGALPDQPGVGFVLRWQQPPRGGEPAEVGRTLDLTQFLFPDTQPDQLGQIFENYVRTYFPGLEQRNLGMDDLPDARYVTYHATLTDGRECDVLAGVAQNGVFLNHINVTSWDGSKPSVSALKRVLNVVNARQLGNLSGVPVELLTAQQASPLLAGSLYLGRDGLEEGVDLEPVFVDYSFLEGKPVQRLASGELRGIRTVDDLLFELRFTQPHPIPGTEHIMPLSQTIRLFTTPDTAGTWYRNWYENFPDHLPINPDVETDTMSFFEAQPLQPAGDGTNYPIYHTTILNGPTVTDFVAGGGVPVAGEPTEDYRNALQGVGAAAREHIFAVFDGDTDPLKLWRAFSSARADALEFQASCAGDQSLCTKP